MIPPRERQPHAGQEPRLEQMRTDWDLFRLAHSDTPEQARSARRKLLEPYLRPAWKYLLGATRDPDEADELLGEFSIRFLAGAFHCANAEKGELGRMIKKALARLVIEFRVRQRQQPVVESLVPEVSATMLLAQDGPEVCYRSEARRALLELGLEKLSRYEEEHPKNLHYTVLMLRVCYPDDTSEELARIVSLLIERRLTANAFRIMLHDARAHLSQILWETAQGLSGEACPDAARDLLKDFGIWNWCGSWLRSAATDAEPAAHSAQ